MIGNVRDHRHMRGRMRQDDLIDPLHIGRSQPVQRLDTAFAGSFLKWNHNAQFALQSEVRPQQEGAKLGRRAAACNLVTPELEHGCAPRANWRKWAGGASLRGPAPGSVRRL